jgi:hypothetical protein
MKARFAVLDDPRFAGFMNRVAAVLVCCALSWVLGAPVGVAQRVRLFRPDTSASLYVPSPEAETPFISLDEWALNMVFEGSVANYQNLTFLPADYRVAWGGSVLAPVVRSGPDMSLALEAGLKVGRSLVLESQYNLRFPVCVSVRYGAGARKHTDRKMGAAAGIGLEYFYQVTNVLNSGDRALYLTTYGELCFQYRSRATYFRLEGYSFSGYQYTTTLGVGFRYFL